MRGQIRRHRAAIALVATLAAVAPPPASAAPSRVVEREYLLSVTGSGNVIFPVRETDVRVRFTIADDFSADPSTVYWFRDADGRDLERGAFCARSKRIAIPSGTKQARLVVGAIPDQAPVCEIGSLAGVQGTATAEFWG